MNQRFLLGITQRRAGIRTQKARFPAGTRNKNRFSYQRPYRRVFTRRAAQSRPVKKILVELIGIEPTTSGLQSPRSPS